MPWTETQHILFSAGIHETVTGSSLFTYPETTYLSENLSIIGMISTSLHLSSHGRKLKEGIQEEKGTTENEMVGWHQRLNGHEFEQASGVGDRQGSLTCYSPWGCKESDTTEQLN